MPVGINQPSNQIRLTNVSLVRLKKGKKRFEIACYKNKILEYRSGAEPDLDNVLQIHSIFLSVSKGQTAPAQDLAKAFGAKTPLDEIIKEILKRGEVQVGEKERHAQLDRVHHEVLDIVSGKLVDPKSQRPYTTGMIGKALDQLSSGQGAQHKQQQQHEEAGASAGKGGENTIKSANGDDDSAPNTTTVAAKAKSKEKDQQLPTWTGVVATKSAKSQALEAMKALIAWQPIPVARARMRLRITCPITILKQPVRSAPPKKQPSSHHEEDDDDDDGDGQGDKSKAPGTVKDRILSYVEQVESQDISGQEWEVVGFVEPGAFKGLGEFVGEETRGKGRVEVLDMAVLHEGD